MKNFKKFTLPVICIALFLISYLIYSNKQKTEKAYNDKMAKISQEYNEVLKDLRNERLNLNKALESTKGEHEELSGKGSTIILISNKNKEIVNEVEQMLDSYGYKGIIAINTNYSPEDNIEGCLNFDDINRLTEKGYELAVIADGFSDVIAIYKKYQKLGLDIKAFYFPNNDMNSTQAREIKSLDVDFIINQSTNEYGEIIPIVTIGSYEKDATNTYITNVVKSEIIALIIGEDDEQERYYQDNVETMLKVIKNYVNDELTEVVNFTGAKKRYEEYRNMLYSFLENGSIERINELEIRFEELKKQLVNSK